MHDHSHDHHDSHEHGHNHDHDHHGHSHAIGHAHLSGAAPQLIIRVIGVTLVFMLIEILGGFWANSLALISDGFHMLSDVGAMILSLFAIWISKRPSTSSMSFGYQRAEILGALVSGLIIWLIAGGLVYESIVRLQNPPEVQGVVVFVIAGIGLLANFLSMRILHSASEENMNVRAAYLHMLSDAIASIAAVIAGLVLWLTHWRPIDAIVTLLSAAIMLYSSWSLIKQAVGILMEATPAGIDPDEIRNELKEIEGVIEIHDLHIWTVASGKLALSVHIISNAAEKVLGAANHLLQEHYGIIHTTIQIENPEHFASSRCYDCSTSSHG
jgi:cobalt-zinc-cadmium efflux system protein